MMHVLPILQLLTDLGRQVRDALDLDAILVYGLSPPFQLYIQYRLRMLAESTHHDGAENIAAPKYPCDVMQSRPMRTGIHTTRMNSMERMCLGSIVRRILG